MRTFIGGALASHTVDVVPATLIVPALVLTSTGTGPVIDGAVVGGLAIVVPLALGGWRCWAGAALAAAFGLRLGSGGVAAVSATPALALALGTTWSAWRAVTSSWPRIGEDGSWGLGQAAHHVASIRPVGARCRMVPGRLARSARLLASGRSVLGAEGDLLPLVHLLVAAWAVVAGTSLLASLAGLRLFDIGEPLVRLTAVHYLYAGVGALTIAGRVAASGAIWPRLASVAVVATATAPPLVAGGFVTRHPVLQIGGAVVMTIGVWSTAVLLLFGVSRAVGGPARLFRLAAGVTPWVPMVLAVAWATAQHVVGAPALSVRDMARLHGLANGIGFVLAGLLATNTVHLARPVRQDGPA